MRCFSWSLLLCVKQSVVEVEILLQSQDYWPLKQQQEQPVLRRVFWRSTQLSPVGWRWGMQGGDAAKPQYLRQGPALSALSYLDCEFVVPLPSPVTHGLQTDLMGSAVLLCPSLKYQCAGQLLDLGSGAPGTNSCICFSSGESTETQRQRNESPSWAHTISAARIGSSGRTPQVGGLLCWGFISECQIVVSFLKNLCSFWVAGWFFFLTFCLFLSNTRTVWVL